MSLVELADGRTVSGGSDDSIAVWSAAGCSATWPLGRSCCRSESAVLVARAPEPGAFLTLGETRWVDEEHGSAPLGLRRWHEPQWSVEQLAVEVEGLLGPPVAEAGHGASGRPSFAFAADGSCIAGAEEGRLWVTDLSGHATRGIDTHLRGRPEHLAVAPRCAAVALVTDDGVWLCIAGECLPP